MADDRLPIVREMILARDEEERRSALDRLLPLQQGDFEGIFEAMAGFPVTIRLLDPPLHEFLPLLQSEAMRGGLAPLHEANPMLGTRGCRLGLQFPEIYEMQVRAIVRAARAVAERTGRGAARRDHAPARRLPRGARAAAGADRARRGRGAGGRVPVRDDDRASARRAARGRDRGGRRLLLVRDERPHPDGARVLARRRRGQVPDLLPRARDPRAEPVRGARRGRGRRPDADRGRAGESDEARHQARHLRRARRRAALGRVLPRARARLRRPARRTACRSRASRRRRPRSPRSASRRLAIERADGASAARRAGPPPASGPEDLREDRGRVPRPPLPLPRRSSTAVRPRPARPLARSGQAHLSDAPAPAARRCTVVLHFRGRGRRLRGRHRSLAAVPRRPSRRTRSWLSSFVREHPVQNETKEPGALRSSCLSSSPSRGLAATTSGRRSSWDERRI